MGRRLRAGLLAAGVVLAATPLVSFAAASPPAQPVVGDFDGDGRGDLLRHGEQPGRSTVWFGHADRRPRSEGVLSPEGATPVAGDFDGDGRTDVFWYGYGTAPDRVWYGGADQGFVPKTFAVNGGYEPFAGDFDGDGRDDVFWYRRGSGPDYVWWGLAGRRFGQTTVNKSGAAAPYAGDFDGDGRTDVLWRDSGTSHVIWFGAASRRFGTVTQTGASGQPLVGDFNGDLVDDVLWYAPGKGTGGTVWVGLRSRGFVPAAVTVAGGFEPFVADFDGDLHDDVFWYRPGSGTDSVWFGAAGAVFVPLGASLGGSYLPVVTDLDGDRPEDVVWYDGSARLVSYGRPDRTVVVTQVSPVLNRVAALRPEAMLAGYDPFGYVAHAMGPIQGRKYTNSKEAFEANYRAGYRVFEVDFVRLGDGHVVAAHDGLERSYGLTKKFKQLTWPEVKGAKLNGRFRVMDAAEVVSLFRSHRDAYLITDAKWDNAEVLRVLLTTVADPQLQRRIVPHVEGQADLDAIRRFFPLQNYVLALYRTQFRGLYDDPEVLEFVRRNDAPAVMMWHRTRDRSKSLAQNGRESRRFEEQFAASLQQAGAVVYVHSINNAETMRPFRVRRVGVYADTPYPGVNPQVDSL